MKNIVVSGATSFIGIHLLNVLLSDKNNHVFALVRPNSPNKGKLKSHENLTVMEFSLQKIENLPSRISVLVDVFYHLAWDGTRASARDDQLLQENNYQSSIRAVKVAFELGCKSFVGVGSQAEYGMCIGRITENYKVAPLTEYGKAKLRTCEDGKKLADSFGLKFVWARIFSVYGQGDFEGTLIMSAISKMIRNERIPLTECTQSWDFLHVLDAASALFFLSSAPAGIYNIASGVSRPLKDFVYEMLRLTDSNSVLEFGVIPYNTEGAVSFEPVIDKLIAVAEWAPKISFGQGVSEIRLMKERESYEKNKCACSVLE
ncbi:MAG TPA: NAD(P)-dependent oxidoreductase [Desulfosporosinus sp.]|nr:NAD(P)-dependent oxidoreductase [Desulfosporosinus sp.]